MSPQFTVANSDSIAAAEPLLGRPESRSKVQGWLQAFAKACALLTSAWLCYFLISHYLVQSVRVVGMSMVPTLHDSQFYLLNRWVLHLRAPHRSEIVVLRDPLDGGFAVKRVIGVAGDSIYLAHGELYLNGQKLDESYLAAGTRTFPYSRVHEQLFKCRAGQYFVLGDNRGNSLDSRTYGPVSRANILGLIVR